MAQEGEEAGEVKVEPDDPEYTLEEHVAYKRKQEAINIQLKRLIREGLSEFKQIMDGTAYAYTKVALSNKGITSITEIIAEYPHLRQIDLSTNQISDLIHLQKLKYLTHLNLSRNCISDGKFLYNPSLFPYLKSLNLSSNKLKSLPSVELPQILSLNLTNNQIQSLQDFGGHPTLQTLELRGNKIKSLKQIKNCPSLKNLYLADNSISSLNGIHTLPVLQRLHLRKNKLSDLSEFPTLPALHYLNVRQNQIAKVDMLKNISLAVKFLNLLSNPVSEQLGDNTKKEVWMKYRQYSKINKSQVTSQEREEFDKEYKERIAEQERQEKEAREQAEREAAEKAEGEAQ